MSTAFDPGTHACQTCRELLNVYTQHEQTMYRHATPPPDNHPARPIPAEDLPDPIVRCDFCSSPHAEWSYHLQPLEIHVADRHDQIVGRHAMGERWAACRPCAALIDAHDIAAVTRRAIHRARRHGRSDLETRHWHDLHRAVLSQPPISRRRLRPPTATPVTHPAADADPLRGLRPHILPKIRDRLAEFWQRNAATTIRAAIHRGHAHTFPAHLFEPPPTDDPIVTDPANAPLPTYAEMMANHATGGRLYWIDPDFTELAAQAAAVLDDLSVSAHEVPTPAGLLVWSDPVGWPTLPETGEPVAIVAAQWGPIPAGTWVTFYTTTNGRTADLTEVQIQELRHELGWLIPVSSGTSLYYDIQPTRMPAGTAPLLAALLSTWLLIAQGDADTSEIQADKAIRKAYARAGRPAPTVRLIRLRETKARPTTPKPVGSDKPSRNYAHRWWVPGFWRQRQAYGPKHSLRRRTFVRGHVKGPDGAPFIGTKNVHILGRTRHRPESEDDNT